MLGIIAGALCVIAVYLMYASSMKIYAKGLQSTLMPIGDNKFEIEYPNRMDPLIIIGFIVLNVFITPAILVVAGVMLHAAITGA